MRGQRQGDGEGRAGHAEEQAQQQRLFVAVDAEFPGAEQGADDDHLADQPGGFRRQAISQHAHHKAQYGPGQNRRGHHQPALLGGQVQVGGDLHRQRAEQVPDHEAQVEIEEGREQCRGMAGFPEA